MHALRLAALACLIAAAPASAAGLKTAIHAGYDDVSGGGGSGAVLGFDLGYDAPLGPLAFVGGMATYGSSTAKSCRPVNADDRVCRSTGDDLGAFGRIGAALPFGPRVYALGGGSRVRVAQRLLTGNAVIATDRDWHNGYLLGAGVEMPFAVFGYGKVEYRHADYGGGISRQQLLVGAGIEF